MNTLTIAWISLPFLIGFIIYLGLAEKVIEKHRSLNQ
jgi:hypothetical protein